MLKYKKLCLQYIYINFIHPLAAIPYTVRVVTGPEKNHGTDSPAWVKINGLGKKHTGKMYLELAQKKAFEPGSVETFSIEALELKDVKSIEVSVLILIRKFVRR